MKARLISLITLLTITLSASAITAKDVAGKWVIPMDQGTSIAFTFTSGGKVTLDMYSYADDDVTNMEFVATVNGTFTITKYNQMNLTFNTATAKISEFELTIAGEEADAATKSQYKKELWKFFKPQITSLCRQLKKLWISEPDGYSMTFNDGVDVYVGYFSK